MIYELLVLLVPLVAGCALMHAQGLKGWALPAFGFVAGLMLQVAIGSLLVFSGLPWWQWLTLSLTLALPVAWWIHRRIRDPGLEVDVRVVVLILVLFAGAIAFFWSANLVKWHADSFRYLMLGSLMNGDHFDVVVPSLLSTRLLGTSILHAPAGMFGESYLRALTPFMAISCLFIVAWFSVRGLEGRLSRGWAVVFAVVGALVLVTVNRYVWHAFYLNGHLYFGIGLLIIAGCAWLQGRRVVSERALLTLQAIAIPSLVVTRPEGTIMAALVLVPVLVNEQVPWRRRALLLVVLGTSTALWQAYHAWSYHSAGIGVPGYAAAFLVLGVVIALVAPIMGWQGLRAVFRHVPTLVETGLWLALLVAAFLQPHVFVASVKATLVNTALDGASWGYSLVMIAILALCVLVATRNPERFALRFAVTTFLPMSFLLAHLREGAYRVGDGDSLSRMFIHILPLVVLFLVSAASAEWRRIHDVGRWNRLEYRS